MSSRFQPLTAAVLFAVSFMVGVFSLTTPHFDAPDAAWVSFWNDHSHRVTAIVAIYALLVAGAALVWFTAQLGARVGSRLVPVAGWASAIMIWVTGVLLWAVPAAQSISGAPAPGADVSRIVTDMGAGALTVFAAPVASFMLIVACVLALRTGALARPLCWLGIIVAIVVGTLGVVFIPLPLLPLWILLAGADLSFAHRAGRVAVPAAA